ncbi:hypothetical protein [uncultured Chryseobacterium sp.]|uniref:hypothetical protein n=1 Tax=uncultured Chryseobacterium sp. TaxID=259322 RepID=UPI0025F7E3EF|nr:hypothetical protein [uncultured Chryseobacterium sp.]
MNLAISSLIIFLLLSPAIVARRLYYTRELSRDYVSRNTLQEIFSSILLAFVLHVVWICFLCISDEIDYDIIFRLLFSPDKIKDFASVTENIGKISCYFISITIISAIASHIIKGIVRSAKWDRKTNILRYDNHWLYLLSKGEIFDIKKYFRILKKNEKDIQFVLVDILVKSKETVRYTGGLLDFKLQDNNSLDYIILSAPIIKTIRLVTTTPNNEFISADEEETFESDIFIIPYSDILNINLRYLNNSELEAWNKKAEEIKAKKK